MRLSDVFAELGPVVGLSSLIGAPESIGNKAAGVPTLAAATARRDQLKQAMDASTSDYSYWGYYGDYAYWKAIVALLEAAEITGPDNLPDVPLTFRDATVVMDQIGRLESFAKTVTDLARAAQSAALPEGASGRADADKEA